MKRRLLMVERIMYVDAATPLNCVFAAKIQGNINQENLHAALLKIQRKHPLLRASINENSEDNPYFIFNDAIAKIPVRVVTRLTGEDWLKESKAEWYKLFDDVTKPMIRLVWLCANEVSELLLVMPHCICDGTTCVTLMTEILTLLDNPNQELKEYTSFKSIEELMPDSFNIAKATRKARAFGLLGKLFFYFKAMGNKVAAGNNYVLHWKLNLEQTQNIIEACKNEGTSVHGALCAAFLRAFQLVKGDKAHGKIISPVDIRHFIPQIKVDNMFAFAPIVELTVDKKISSDFWDIARKIKVDLISKIASMNINEMLWVGEQMHASVSRMVKVLRTTNGSHDITLSNMGRLHIPERFQSFELETIYSPTVAFPWRNPNTLVTSTFKNQMDFALMSNDSFMTESDAWKIKEKAMELLFENLPHIALI